VGIALLIAGGAPCQLVALVVAGVVGLGVTVSITLRWEMSIHTGVATSKSMNWMQPWRTQAKRGRSGSRPPTSGVSRAARRQVTKEFGRTPSGSTTSVWPGGCATPASPVTGPDGAGR
jgi:hypothetical protein